MDLNIHVVKVLNIGGQEVYITETHIGMWIISVALILFALLVRHKLKSFTDKPTGFQNVIETMVEMFNNFVRSSAGDRLFFLGNWFFTVFAVILISNLSGLFFMRPPTADWCFTFPLAFITFLLIQAMGVKFRGTEYLKELASPNPVFLPLNILGELARPVSLSFRLFGNVLGGMILLGLIYDMAPKFVLIGIPSALHAYFDVASGMLQTYIFSILSLSFIGSVIGDAE